MIYFVILKNIKKKFLLFFVTISLFFSLGLYYNLDGLVFMFFIAELTILLIFITMFSQLYTYYSYRETTVTLAYVYIFIFLLNIPYINTTILSYKNYYSFYAVNINDFYYIYNFFFEKQILVTFIITIILTFYSIFFILVYFRLKSFKNNENKKINNIVLLRKQNMIHQNNYSPSIRLFQN